MGITYTHGVNVLLVSLMILLVNGQENENAVHYHDTVVIGAGPAGLQHSWYLKTSGADYITFEQAASPGGSFKTVPRWRKLISINKVNLGRDTLDYNLRHDWNSLLSDPSHMMGRKLVQNPSAFYTLFPEALRQNRSRAYGTGTQEAADNELRQKILSCCTELATRAPVEDNIDLELDECTDIPHWLQGCVGSSDIRSSVANASRGMLFRHFSEIFYPNADTLMDYFQSYKKLTKLNILYNTTVLSISGVGKLPQEMSHKEEEVRYEISTSRGRYFCHTLIIAIGVSKPAPNFIQEGAELVESYETASTDLEHYKGKRVLIIGRGNAALEFADNVMEVAAYVHLLGGIHRRLRLAWESHYPGDLRAVHTKVLESYQLKTLDALIETPLEQVVFDKTSRKVMEEYDGRQQASFPLKASFDILRDWTTSPEADKMLSSLLQRHSRQTEVVTKFHKSLNKLSANLPTISYQSDGIFSSQETDDFKDFQAEPRKHATMRSRPKRRIIQDYEIAADNLFDFPPSEDGLFYRHRRSSYDIVIACLGWKMDTKIFNASATPILDKAKKYPVITPQYESINNPGMYFVGTLAHSIDFRVAAGGFIHGFRYTSRILHRLQEEMSDIEPGSQESMWPVFALQPQSSAHSPKKAEKPKMLDLLVTRVQHRLNHASGLYQMFNGHLCDVVLLQPVEHAKFDHNAFSSQTLLDQDTVLPWSDSGDPVEHLVMGWIDGKLSIDENSHFGITTFVFEDVPAHVVPYLVRRWALRLFGKTLFTRNICPKDASLVQQIDCMLRYYNGIRYSTYHLEYSKEWSLANGTRDPFKTSRVLGSKDRPADSGFLHPVMTAYDTRMEDKDGYTTAVLERLQFAGVRPPIHEDSVSHVEADPDIPDLPDSVYGDMDVRDRTPVISEAIFEDFSAEFYTYWKVTRPFQRFFLELFRRHALTHAVVELNKAGGAQRLTDGSTAILLAHNVKYQLHLLDNTKHLLFHANAGVAKKFMERCMKKKWTCEGDQIIALRNKLYSVEHGFSRRRSILDIESVTHSAFGVSALVSAEGGMASDVYHLLQHLMKSSPEHVFHGVACDSFSMGSFIEEHEGDNSTQIHITLAFEPVLIFSMTDLEIDIPQFSCAGLGKDNPAIQCAPACNYQAFGEFVDGRTEQIPDNPTDEQIVQELLAPAIKYIDSYCLHPEAW